MDRPYTLIANAKSGKRDSARIDALVAALRAQLDAPLRFVPVRKGREIAAAAREARAVGHGTVFVAGGDGTLSGVAEILKGSGVAMAVVPFGTFNFFARGLDVPETMEEAVAALVAGRVEPLAVGEVNGRLFLNNASFGLYPSILAAREDIYRNWGRSRLAAYWSVLRTLSRPGHRMRLRITADGQVEDLVTPMLFVGANPYQLGFYKLDGTEEIEAGRLAAFAGADSGRMGMLRTAVRLMLGTARKQREFHLIAGQEIVIETPRKRLMVAIDGERQEVTTPIRLRLAQDLLQVVRPAPAPEAKPAEPVPEAGQIPSAVDAAA